MTTSEILSIIGLSLAFLGMIGGFIAFWVKFNVQVTELREQSSLGLRSVREESALKIDALKKEIAAEMEGVEAANELKINGLRREVELHIKAVQKVADAFSSAINDKVKVFMESNQKDHDELKMYTAKIYEKFVDAGNHSKDTKKQ